MQPGKKQVNDFGRGAMSAIPVVGTLEHGNMNIPTAFLKKSRNIACKGPQLRIIDGRGAIFIDVNLDRFPSAA